MNIKNFKNITSIDSINTSYDLEPGEIIFCKKNISYSV